ncbi:hypothetical protein FGO68_gene8086 [Halteria grandinella]|uniref:Uncharacterized protein n=1 Tax=Halteria grandinella TaxID=5974 RepID=A0A8J8NCB1_HALGN|nr:hypothetical protein FGO68_gene8086 [Halteria grandinella]
MWPFIKEENLFKRLPCASKLEYYYQKYRNIQLRDLKQFKAFKQYNNLRDKQKALSAYSYIFTPVRGQFHKEKPLYNLPSKTKKQTPDRQVLFTQLFP